METPAAVFGLFFLLGCGGAAPVVPAPEAPVRHAFSAFGPLQSLPSYSGWCGADPSHTCASRLNTALDAGHRPSLRAHGWHLWGGFNEAANLGKEAVNQANPARNAVDGTVGCNPEGSLEPSCWGAYRVWMTWPNTGRPLDHVGEPPAPIHLGRLRDANSRCDPSGHADPSKHCTVNTPAPTYAVPPQVFQRACKLSERDAQTLVTTDQPAMIIKYQQICREAGAPNVLCAGADGRSAVVCDGTSFVNQGDVMIATESISGPAYNRMQEHKLFAPGVLQGFYERGRSIASWIPTSAVVTKHMYWPVKGCLPGVKVGSEGCRVRYGALPPWIPAKHRGKNLATDTSYGGYETWGEVVAIDTCAECPEGNQASLALWNVSGASAITTTAPEIFDRSAFLGVQVSAGALANRFTAADRALLDQAMLWAYGPDAVGFEAGDYLMTVAMHINTKELPSWGLQSVWWSPKSDTLQQCPADDPAHCYGQTDLFSATGASGEILPTSGLTPLEVSALDTNVSTAWRDYYVMVDSWGISREIDGSPVEVANYFPSGAPQWATKLPQGGEMDPLPVAMNVYIEPVLHPLGTNCQNCHRRAGVPDTPCADYAGGCGKTSYQTAQCPSLLGDYGSPSSTPCMTAPAGGPEKPILSTDRLWILADGHGMPADPVALDR